MHERSPAASRWHPTLAGWKNLDWDYLTRFAMNILVKDISLASTKRSLPCLYLSVHLAIYLSTPIYPPIHLCIFPSILLSIYPSIHLSTHASIYLSTAQEIPCKRNWGRRWHEGG